MSSETDQPRQRTVAELLAQHGGGDAASTGRRRRRRDPDESADDFQNQPSGPSDADGPGSPPWPQAHSPNPERAGGQPPTALAGSAHEPGSWDAPRPPAALPQQYAPPGQVHNGATQRNGIPSNGAGPNGAGPNGAGPNGAGPNRGGPPIQQAPAQWGAPQQQAWTDRSEPQRRNPPTTGWERPGPPRQEQPRDPAKRPGAPWDARPWDAGPAPAQPDHGRSGPLPIQPDQGFREPPPRAFAPGPEPVRSTPPFAASPHAGSAPLPTAAAPFGPPGAPRGFGGRPDDPGATGPIDAQRLQALGRSESTSRVQSPLAPGRPPGADDGGPATAVGLPPAGAEDWHRRRTGQDRPGPDRPGPDRPGPDRPGPDRPGPDVDGGPPTQASAPMDFDDYDDIDSHPAGLAPAREDRDTEGRGSHEFEGAFSDQPRSADAETDAAERSSQSWAPVVAQWVLGAIGGAALWVGFRFLWSSLLVVAIAAAVLVTVGLVIVVRTVLRNTDLRTTLAAVAVGILLTVSPAVLVLLGR